MITEEEFYITEEIKTMALNDPDTFKLNKVQLAYSEGVPLLHMAAETLEDYYDLSLHLKLTDRREDFIVNCYYFLLGQQDLHGADGEQTGIAVELALEDLKHTLKDYNERKLAV